jgi:aspartyl-tRNA(Asn)/glutamyl-tRNA(Gln) amidotransferase subunit A
MARAVEDTALLLNAIAGPDAEDEGCAVRPAVDFTRDLGRVGGGLTLGVPREWFFEGVEPGIEAAVREAISVLEGEGSRRVDVAMPGMADAHTAHHAILAAEAAAFHGPWLRERPDDYGSDVRRGLELGQLIAAVDYVNARRVRAIVGTTFRSALTEADVLVTPCLPQSPLRVGEAMSREPEVAWNRLLTPVNVAGLPAISLPCGFDGAGMPVGLQIIGRSFEETLVLRVARAYERATEWGGRRPPV